VLKLVSKSSDPKKNVCKESKHLQCNDITGENKICSGSGLMQRWLARRIGWTK